MLAGRDPEDVAGLQVCQRSGDLGAMIAFAFLGRLGLQRPDAVAQFGVLTEIAAVALRLRPQDLGLLVIAAGLPGHRNHPPVGLELREALLQQRAGAHPSDRPHQIDRHVVGRRETRLQRIGSPRCQPGQCPRVHSRLPEHHGMTFDVDTASSGPAGQLGVLAGAQLGVGLAVVLHELLDHHCAGRHVDAQRQCLGGEDNLHQTFDETFLHDRLEDRQQSGVMGGDAASEGFDEGVPVERAFVGRGQHAHMFRGDLQQLLAFGTVGEPDVGSQHLANCLVAALSAEDEEDRGQQILLLQHLDRAVAPGCPDDALPTGALPRFDLAAHPAATHPPGVIAGDPRVGLRQPQQLRIDIGPGLRQRYFGGCLPREQVVQSAAHQHMLIERDDAAFADHHIDLAAHFIEPLAEFLGIGDRRGQRDQLNRIGQPEDHFLPDGAAEPVGQIVHLVHHYRGKPRQGPRAGIDHVAEHLGGHHHDRRLGVDRGVTGQQANIVCTVPGHQIMELLVAQGLDRGGVEALRALPQRQPAGELPHHGLARPGRGGHQHAMSRGELQAGVGLEVVKRK